MKTRQEMFDIAYAQVLAQGGRSVSREGCAYRGADGRRCGVGWLIDDDVYNPDFEGDGVYSVVSKVKPARALERALRCSGVPLDDPYDVRFLEDLQDAHDDTIGGDFAEKFKAAMAHVARRWNLEVPDV